MYLDEGYLQALLELTSSAACKWREIGLHLGFINSKLDEIANTPENISGGPSACFRDLLSRWLNWAPPNHIFPSVEALESALRSPDVEKERAAFDLSERLHESSE